MTQEREYYCPKGEDRDGYCRAVRVGDQLWISGTTATNEQRAFAGPFASVMDEFDHILGITTDALDHFGLAATDVRDAVLFVGPSVSPESIASAIHTIYPRTHYRKNGRVLVTPVRRLDDPRAQLELKLYANAYHSAQLSRFHEHAGVNVGITDGKPVSVTMPVESKSLRDQLFVCLENLRLGLTRQGVSWNEIVDLIINVGGSIPVDGQSVNVTIDDYFKVSALTKQALSGALPATTLIETDDRFEHDPRRLGLITLSAVAIH